MRILLLLAILIISFSCQDRDPGLDQDVVTFMIPDSVALPQPIALHPAAQRAIVDWPKFQEFDNSFTRLYKAENKEDLILIVDDLIEKHQELAASPPPEKLNSAQIKSRMVVVLTNLHLIKSSLYYSQPVTETLQNTVQAYNAFRSQMNIQVTNTLDTKTIFDD